jgi:galactokinase
MNGVFMKTNEVVTRKGNFSPQDEEVFGTLKEIAVQNGLDIEGGKVCKTSSRFCLGVEHGDYNGTELFGVGTNRFIWQTFKPNNSNKYRFFSYNFPEDGIVEFEAGKVPEPKTVKDSSARFPYGVDYELRKAGFDTSKGYDAVQFSNIPGGGMSRSASLTINLILCAADVNGFTIDNPLDIIDMAVAVENEYIGSPCGELDQIMILFAREGMGTHYNPADRSIRYVPLGPGGEDLRIIGLDTGTKRPGLEKSTYKIRRQECDEFADILSKEGWGITRLADIRDDGTYQKVMDKYADSHPDMCERLKYIYKAQKRFYQMLEAWEKGDIAKVGAIFRQDGIGLRDEYKISGPELETMCDIVRTVDGVLGERMLGGGDKGAAGALALSSAVDDLQRAVDAAYPRSRPDYADKYAVHVCKVVNGVTIFS